jgi:alanyl-tRNA synthetase
MSLAEAKALGAEALFEDKYGDMVRVVSIENFSRELCGGTHVDNTGKIGLFKIENESGVSAGIRRIEALTGFNAYHDIAIKEKILTTIEKLVKSNQNQVQEKIEELLYKIKTDEKELVQLKNQILRYEILSLQDRVEEINGVKIWIHIFAEKSIDELSYAVDYLKDKYPSSVIFFASKGEKALFAAGITKDLTGKIKAGDLVKKAAQTAGGNGGGRPDFAQAGAKDPHKICDAIKEIKKIILQTLSSCGEGIH